MNPERIGKYQVIGKIGAGSMGVVYKALDPKLGRPVAVKVLPPHLVERDDIRERFRREAVTPARLSHPNIVAVFDLDEDEGTPFIVLEFIDGVSLAQILQAEVKLEIPQVLNILIQAAEGLDFAHGKGVIHRDVKPGNILLDRNGVVKVVDFGIARALEGPQHTRTGLIMGTPCYMSPEQIRGSSLTRSTDQFSLGVVAYELVTGFNPFSGESFPTILLNVLDVQPKAPRRAAPHCPPEVEGLIQRAMQKNPALRFDSLRAFSEGCREVRKRFPEEAAALAPLFERFPDGLQASGTASGEEKWMLKTIPCGGADASLSAAEAGSRSGSGMEDQPPDTPPGTDPATLAQQCLDQGECEKALVLFQQAIAADPADIRALRGVQQARKMQRERLHAEQIRPLLAEAARLAAAGEYPEALDKYRRIRELDPNYVEVLELMEDAEDKLAHADQFRRRVRELEEALIKTDFPGVFQLLRQLAEAYPRETQENHLRDRVTQGFLTEFSFWADQAGDRRGLINFRDWLENVFSQEGPLRFFTDREYPNDRDRFLQKATQTVTEWVDRHQLPAGRVLLDSLAMTFMNDPRVQSLDELLKSREDAERVAAASIAHQRLLYKPVEPPRTFPKREAPAPPVLPAKAPLADLPPQVAPPQTVQPRRRFPGKTHFKYQENPVQACLKVIMQRPDFPAISRTLQETMRILEDEGKSLRLLTNIILKDYSLTVRVLRTANSFHYNRSGHPVLSVSQAVVLLGSETIRHLTAGMLILEHFSRKSPGLKELMLLSLLTGNHVRELAAHVHFPSAEEAYLCGLFRNLGEVLIACYFPVEYVQILMKTKETAVTIHAACREALGFCFEELGQAMAVHWNVSEKVGQCMTDVNPNQVRTSRSEFELLRVMVAFGHGLTTAIYRQEAADAKLAVKDLIQRFRPALPLDMNALREIVDTALRETRDTFAMLDVPVDDLRLRRQCEAAVETQNAGVTPAAGRAKEGPEMTTDLLDVLTMEAEALLRRSDAPDLNHVILTILEALTRGCGCLRALFCLVTPDKTQVQARLGLGEGVEALVERFVYGLNVHGGPVASAVLSEKDTLVTDISQSPFSSSGLGGGGIVGFGLFPMRVDGVLVGCLYFDWGESRPEFDPPMIQGVSRLRDLATQAIRRIRSDQTPSS